MSYTATTAHDAMSPMRTRTSTQRLILLQSRSWHLENDLLAFLLSRPAERFIGLCRFVDPVVLRSWWYFLCCSRCHFALFHTTARPDRHIWVQFAASCIGGAANSTHVRSHWHAFSLACDGLYRHLWIYHVQLIRAGVNWAIMSLFLMPIL